MKKKDEIRTLQGIRYSYRRDRWINVSQSAKVVTPLPSTFDVLTWNVQHDGPDPIRRLTRALSYIQREVLDRENGERPDPCCIVLQEVHMNAFDVLLISEWVQDNFVIVPASPRKWPNRAVHGNVVLVSRTIPVLRAC